MSLTLDGVWKAGVWATTVWADGVWREGARTQPAAEPFSGGYEYPLDRRRRRKDEEAEAVIEAVAVRQAAQPVQDEQQRFEELERELALRGLEWKVQYLEAMNERRAALIKRRTAERMLLLIAAALA